jgi:8-oxo-dGTP diphosphatase
MKEASVVTCFLLRRGAAGDEVLLLRRSDRVSTYRGRWAGVSGYLEDESPLEQAYREIREEVGLSRGDVRLLAEAEPLTFEDESIGMRWAVHLFLFEALRPEAVRLDWEHTESRWVRPEEIAGLETVPGLADGLARVYPPR